MTHRTRLSMHVSASLLCLWVLSAPGGEIIRGTVFRDTNANGQREPGEPGIGDVRVTDGVNFTRSAKDGSFGLELGTDPVLSAGGIPTVTVSFPSDYWPTTPWFVRLDENRGPDDLVFGLRPEVQRRPFVFVHATDPHVPRKGEERIVRFREDIDALNGVARFCILTGDLADLADSHTQAVARTEFELFAHHTKTFPIPWFGLPGNHDIAGVRAKNGWDTNSAEFGYGLYGRHVGPLRWSFDYAGVHFVGIDYNQVVSNRWTWGAPESSVRWLAQDLESVKRGRRVFLFVHDPRSSSALSNLLARFKVTQIFHGHDHQDASRKFANVPALSSASLSEVFDDKDRTNGYRLVRVTRTGMDTFYRSTGQPHSINVDYPRFKDTLTPGKTIKGAFFDPSHSIDLVTVTYAGEPVRTRIRRGPLWSRFSAKLESSNLPPGSYPLVVTASHGDQSWRREFSYRYAPPRQAAR